MDCYYHNAVPSVAACVKCRQPVCATCRSAQGDCPGCRLAAKIDAAASAAGELPGRVPPRRGAAPPPPYASTAPARRRTAVATVSPESRALLALSYPFWPLALLALLDGSKSPFVRRHALQALGFNFGVYGLWLALSAITAIPLLGLSAWPLLALVVPVSVVASVVYGIKAWHGEDVRVPIVSDIIDAAYPLQSSFEPDRLVGSNCGPILRADFRSPAATTWQNGSSVNTLFNPRDKSARSNWIITCDIGTDGDEIVLSFR